MFETLTERFSETLRKVAGKSTLTEDNIQETLREVRQVLLEADVALPVVKDFVDQVRTRALGQEVLKSLSPGQAFLRIVQRELEQAMGAANEGLDLSVQPPAVILMAGLQGSGKTTSAAKLARWLREKGKKVLMVSADVYRPAAIHQLETLAAGVDAGFIPSHEDERPVDIAREALRTARIQFADVLIVDTAGRLAIDAAMMQEIRELHAVLNPAETLFVVDAMTGQDAAATARAFNEAVPLTGVILAKADADSRGGAALSVRAVTGKPIKFLGVGEKTDALEPFHPERVASRILGMGDILSLIEEAERKLDREKAEKLAKKIRKGKGFDLTDFRDQLQQMRDMGGIASMLDKLPGMSGLAQMAQEKVDIKTFTRMEAIINSMTPAERRDPEMLNGSRKRRITQGSGTSIQDLNRLLKQHKQMQKMMKKLGNRSAMQNMMRGLGGMLPPGGGFPRR
ncbi:MAG: signal recognition particle protein [Pseudomonadales bacterium]|jgi:signal recognition particle subunit SRP54|nr:signal recognition particle protein [Pseudomonadales bacterium]MCP5338415.1 signal recognition particle protein [Pseudomonadales bacterium]